MNKTKITIYFTIITLGLLGVVRFTSAAVVWSTTFNCPYWDQTLGYSGGGINIGCDGLGSYKSMTNNRSMTQITSVANYIGGAGGNGVRFWNGDGKDNISDTLQLDLTIIYPPSITELWIRWYMRYEQDFQWSQIIYDKLLRFNTISAIPNFLGFNSLTIVPYSTSHQPTPGVGWNTIMANGALDANGNRKSDGQWHLYEVHLKANTATGGIENSDGVGEMWVDGVKKHSQTNLGFSKSSGWTGLQISSNQMTVNNGRDMYIDYDDIAISTTGYIGPISGGSASDTTPPSAPSGLVVN